jgi:uncharacterized membrane protein (DUF485 family)
MSPQQPLPPNEVDARRKRARRLALWIAGIAVVVYIGFIVMVGASK